MKQNKDKKSGNKKGLPPAISQDKIDSSRILGSNGEHRNLDLMNGMVPFVNSPGNTSIDAGQIVKYSSNDVNTTKALMNTFNFESSIPTVDQTFLGQGDVGSVQHVSDLPVIVAIPRLDAPYYVPRAVKMYVEFYNYITQYFLNNVKNNFDFMTPASIQHQFGNLQSKDIADQMLLAISGDKSKNQKNIFAIGEYLKENIIYDFFTNCISSVPTRDKVIEAMFWIILYHINKQKDMAQHDEMVISEGSDTICTLFTTFNDQLMSEIDLRIKNFKHPRSIYDFIFNVTEKVVSESSLLSGSVYRSRQSDIQMEFPYLTERFITYLFVNLFIQHQDTIYAGITAKMLRIKTLFDNVTALLKANGAFDVEEWITTLASYDVLTADYKKTSMTGGSITSEILDMYETLKRTDMVFEMAAIIHEARVIANDVESRDPIKPETFSHVISQVKPKLDKTIQELINTLALAQQWLALNVDHIPGINTVTLSELGIQMISIDTLSRVMVTPVIALENRRMRSNEQTATRYTIELPTDSFVRFKVVKNPELKNVSFLTRSSNETQNIDAVLLQSQMINQTTIPSAFQLNLEDQYAALEADLLTILYENKLILYDENKTGSVLSEDAIQLINEQKTLASDILKIHEIWKRSQLHNKTNFTKDDLLNQISDNELTQLDVENLGQDGSTYPSTNSNMKVINELTAKFNKIQCLGDFSTFYAPLSYSTEHMFSHIFLSTILKGFEHLYVSTKTGEMLYPVIIRKNEISNISTALLYLVSLQPEELKALIPSCAVDRVPSENIYIPQTRIGISYSSVVSSTLRESSGINFSRYGKLDSTLPAFVWTTLKNDTVKKLLRTGQMEIAPIAMSTKEYYQLNFIGDDLYWQRQTIKNLLTLYTIDIKMGAPMEDQDRLTQLLMMHLVHVFQQLPIEWLTGVTLQHFAAYKRYGYLTEHYRYQLRLSKDLLSHLPPDSSLLRRLIFVFLTKIFGYGMTLNAITNFSKSGDLGLLNLPVCKPALDVYSKLLSNDVTIRSIINALLNNQELIDRTLSSNELANNLL